MRFGCGLRAHAEFDSACREASQIARDRLGAGSADLAMVFAAASYGPELSRVSQIVRDVTGALAPIGCSAGGVIGGGEEVESRPAVSVLLAKLPEVGLRIAHLSTNDLPSEDAAPAAWTELLQLPPDDTRGILLLPEPFSFATDRLLAGLDYAYPGVPKVGGLCSGATQPGGHALFAEDAVHHQGAVLIGFTGNVRMDSVVAQGCRPIGAVGRITKAENNHLIAIDNQPAAKFLQDQVNSLPETERQIAPKSPVFVGIAMDPFGTDEPKHGDFLIRHVVGLDPRNGVLAIGGQLSVGRQIQFHLRDRDASAEDLRAMLRRRQPRRQPRGTVMFSCLGRGEGLYGVEGHDSRVFAEEEGDGSLAGFFCNGEIGAVGATTHVHGYTSAFALFSQFSPTEPPR